MTAHVTYHGTGTIGSESAARVMAAKLVAREHEDELRAAADAALTFANHLAARDVVRELGPWPSSSSADTSDAPTSTTLHAGVVGDTAGCPVATTAGAATPHPTFGLINGWQIGQVAVRYGPRGGVQDTVAVPEQVREFMAAFDAGAYPELDAAREMVA